MKLKVGVCLLLLTALLFALVGCNGTADAGEEESTQGDSETEEVQGEIEMKVMFGGDANYRLVYGTEQQAISLAESFQAALKKKTGAKEIQLFGPRFEETELEILIGGVTSRKESVEGMSATEYTTGTAMFIGNKLVISAYLSDVLEELLDQVLDSLVQNEDGAWCLPAALKLTVDGKTELKIPTFWSENVSAYQGFYEGNGYYQSAFKLPLSEASIKDYEAYGEKLVAEGYTLMATNRIGDNRFATYANDETEIHLMWYPSMPSFRIAYARRGYLPDQKAPEYEKQMESTVTQLARAGASKLAPGESYVIQLEDGSFVIIDGGPSVDADIESLMNWLNAHKPETDEKPRITWMMTHLHSDHIALPLTFLAKYRNDIDLEMVCYNFPSLGADGLNDTYCQDAATQLDMILNVYYKNTKKFVFHSGQKLYFPGCEVEFLFTTADYWPNEFTTANHTCSAWRMTFSSGKTFMVLGDCEKGLCGQMAACYGSYLQSDVCQLSHHGVNGATVEVYQAIDPIICLWPIDEARWLVDGRIYGIYATVGEDGHTYSDYSSNPDKTKVWEAYRFNYWLWNNPWTRGEESGSRQNYHNSTTVTIRMSDLLVTVG